MSSSSQPGVQASQAKVSVGVVSRRQIQAQVLRLAFPQPERGGASEKKLQRNLFHDLWDRPRLKRWPARFAIRQALTRAQEADLQRELAAIETEFGRRSCRA
ncbi:hypothetical protein PSA7680_03611 [Pseudoruegeria aquimaris]|uniref:Uncharacterized protein n=1 Tax=Pseudoruegeria aquimaris TaxID=393663 RepID=A0A1Y5TUE0_9RHOB|nr:hypothetical protein [Pseudoruegeria aquimaris]SLN68423.1 hypothetical protein PSA7680_03611 [Pseudoruegeria aquimaris]